MYKIKPTVMSVFIGLLILLGGVIGLFWYALYKPVVTAKSGYVYYLRPGVTKKQALAELSEQGIIQFPTLFSIYIHWQKNTYLKTGEYLFRKGSTPVSIWRQMMKGTGLLYHPFAIIPGWSFNQLRQAMLNIEGLRHDSVQLDEQQIMNHLGATIAAEGQFFPDTYYYTRGISDFSILKRAFKRMQNKLNAAWVNRATNLPFKSPYEALIAASLIEKEAYLNSERPIIAGVLINRIKKDMLLQFDPTVIYGLGDHYNGQIHKADLLQDTIYNTYIHKGLPPTPIAMPSMNSINAALHPEQTDYYYFVAKKDRSHQFSKTLIEHNAAVKAIEDTHAPISKNFFNETLLRIHLQKLLFSSQLYSFAWKRKF